MSDRFPNIDSGRYEIVSELGKGGMGLVFKAIHRPLGRPVALKIIKSGLLAGETEVKMFRREIEALAAIHHPNIISIHDVGEFEGQPFYTMDFVDGCTLEEVLNRLGTGGKDSAGSSLQELVARVTRTRAGGGDVPSGTPALASVLHPSKFRALPVNQALHLAVKILSALEHVHNRGIIHRDIKPSNIMITPEGEPLLMDFGLAKSLKAMAGLTVTETGQVMGTPAYMSPEQAEGVREAIGEKSDLYSMGAVLYEMLSGRPPVAPSGHALADLHAVIHKDPPLLRRVNTRLDRDIENICRKALEKEPGRRYRTARGFSEDLDRYLRGEPVLARGQGLWYRFRKKIVKHKISASAAALLLVTAAAFLAYGLRSVRVVREKERALREEKQKSEGRWILAYQNDFDGDTLDWEHWFRFRPDLNPMTAEIRDGALMLEKKGRLFSKVRISGNIKIMFDAAVEGDQEVGGYFSCGDSLIGNDDFYYYCWRDDGLKFQKGRLGKSLDARFFKETPMRDLGTFAGQRIHVSVESENGLCRILINGDPAVESRDLYYLDKLSNGYWGFNSIGGKITVDNLKIFHQLPPENIGLVQVAAIHISENRLDKAHSFLEKIVMNYDNPSLVNNAVNLFSAIGEKPDGVRVMGEVMSDHALVDRIVQRADLLTVRLFLETAAVRMPGGIGLPDFFHLNDRLALRLAPDEKFSLFAYWGMVFRYWKLDSAAGIFFEKAREAGASPGRQPFLEGGSLRATRPALGRTKYVEGGLLALSPERVVPVEPFYMDSTEVTRELFKSIMGYDSSYYNSRRLPREIAPEKEERQPVDHVTWYETVAFCNARSRAEGLDSCYSLTNARDTIFDYPNQFSMKGPRYRVRIFGVALNGAAGGYRLPTPEEFEYALSDGVPHPLFQEYLIDRKEALTWHLDNAGGRPHPAAAKAPNKRGFYDLAGSFWEMCWVDWPPGRNSGFPQTGPAIISMGGGWAQPFNEVGNNRTSSPPWNRSKDWSFRCVRSAKPAVMTR